MVEEIHKYEPDPSFPWKAEDANAPQQNHYADMKLLNYKNTHFDLIVNQGHPLLGQENEKGHVTNKMPTPITNHTHNNTKHVTKNTEANITTEKSTDLKHSKESGNNTANVEAKTPCAHCDKLLLSKKESMEHMKTEHKDEFIYILENKLK